jgi:purine-cytosine permease-like protein
VAYVALAIGLRIARTPLPWLAPMAVAGALVLLAELAELVDPPLWLWPVVVAALCAAWAYAGTRVART